MEAVFKSFLPRLISNEKAPKGENPLITSLFLQEMGFHFILAIGHPLG
jgi:hypothetical protein